MFFVYILALISLSLISFVMCKFYPTHTQLYLYVLRSIKSFLDILILVLLICSLCMIYSEMKDNTDLIFNKNEMYLHVSSFTFYLVAEYAY